MRRMSAESIETRRAETVASFRALAADTGDEVATIIDLYLEYTSEDLDRLSAAIITQSVEASVRAAHTCAGSSLLCGVRRLGLLFAHVEAAARRRRFDLAATLCSRARAEFVAVQKILRAQGEAAGKP